MISFDFKTYSKDLVDENIVESYLSQKESVKRKLDSYDMTDWMSIDTTISLEELKKVKEVAANIQKISNLFIVVGIGGSYLGSKAMIDALTPYFKKNNPEVIYAGNHLSSEYLNDLLEYMDGKSVSVNVISKSGTTLEPNIAFDLIYEKMQKMYSKEELKNRIIVTTGYDHNNLHEFALENHYVTFEVPDKIGGRFSVLSAVGLLPIAVSGIDIDKLLEGAKEGYKLFDEAYQYATMRQAFYEDEKFIEAYTIYEEKLYMYTEWLKQLFAETQGKDRKGVLPISIVNTRDLHSLGQFIQDGSKVLFETVVNIKESKDINIEKYNKSLNAINTIAAYKVCEAHKNGDSPSIIIEIDKLDAYHLGMLTYFFFLASAIGGIMLDVNPFDQPGVSEYKKLLADALKE